MDSSGPGASRTPLRCSKAAHRPFRSPLNDNRPKAASPGDASPASRYPRSFRRSPITLGRTSGYKQQPMKRICSDTESDFDVPSEEEEEEEEEDLSALRRRIELKRQQVEEMKTKLIYRKKSCDLETLTERWLLVCQEALERLHKDLQQQGNTSVGIPEILQQLEIPQDLVRFSQEDCSFF